MKLCHLLLLTLGVLLVACSDSASSTETENRLAPPTPDIHAMSTDSGGAVHVTAVVLNRAGVPLQIAVPPQCLLGVSFFPDSTGAPMSMSGPDTSGCLSNPSTVKLAPGDSLTLTRTIAASELTKYPPGLYGVNVTVVTNTTINGAWGGAVMLPPGQ